MSGINIAISNIPTHQEIYENLPIYAEPNDVDSIRGAIISLNSHPSPHTKSVDYLRLEEKFSFESFIQRFEYFLKSENF